MNLFEASGCLGSVLGGITGGILASQWGTLAAIGASVGGLFGGWMVGVGISALVFGIGVKLEQREERRQLKEAFGKYWGNSAKGRWLTESEKIEAKEQVSGDVVAVMYYGVFLDIGRSFPARLPAKNFDEITAKSPPEKGHLVHAQVASINEKRHLIELTQIHD